MERDRKDHRHKLHCKNLSQKTTYKFKIRACKTDDKKANHYGKYSAEVSATTSKAPAVVTPVSQHGQLSVKGANIVDKNGKVFKIKGMSTHGIMWEDFPISLQRTHLKFSEMTGRSTP